MISVSPLSPNTSFGDLVGLGKGKGLGLENPLFKIYKYFLSNLHIYRRVLKVWIFKAVL